MTIILDGTAGIANNATDLSYTGTLTGSTGVVNIGAGQIYKDASGNVGIGTNSPSYAIDVNRSSVDAQINVQATGANFSSRVRLVGKTGSTDNEWSIVATGGFLAGPQLRFTQGNWTGSPAMTLDASGNLLVGTTTASGKIASVVGSGQVGYYTNKSSGGGGLDHAQYYTDGGLQGKITQTGGFTTVSDYRLKSDVVALSGMLEKVCKLKPVSYTLTAFDQQQFGFIAHELQKELPIFVEGEKDDVNEDGSVAPQSVDYPKIVTVLTAAIQELKAIIDTQATRITALEAK